MNNPIRFENVTFAWLRPDAPQDPAERTHGDLDILYEDTSLDLPGGMVSILGPNGVGKSTLLLLAAARLFPLEGSIRILGKDTREFLGTPSDPELEEVRNRLVSVVYQNMEFETELNLGQILPAIKGGADPTAIGVPASSDHSFDQLIEGLDLGDCLTKRPQDMAKGELQRSVIAMALAYGSPILVMDEPVFALEEPMKRRVFGFLRDYTRGSDRTIYYTAHDFDLCRDYADMSLLLWKDPALERTVHFLGTPGDACGKDRIEEAYKAPLGTLYQKERLYRTMLLEGRNQ